MGENSSERMVLFSDAVIAITITLLVLELRLPTPAEDLSDPQLWAALTGMVPQFFAYALSFAVIAAFWMAHKSTFSTIPRSNGVLTWLNMAFLLSIGLMPFTTAILAENTGSLATALYAGLIAITSLLVFGMDIYADVAGLSDAEARQDRQTWTGIATGMIFALSIPIAFWNADAARYFWILLVPTEIGLGRMTARPRLRAKG